MSEITEHYSFGGLQQRIQAGLDALGEAPTVSLLGAVDEFHVGGRPATEHLVAQLGLQRDDRVLDVGSGLGGLARFIASTTGASVTGFDITAEYVEVASWLTELVGLNDRVTFGHGSAADAATESFTAATMLHVGMNIADKVGVFGEVRRALRSGGRFAIYDIMATGAERPDYPCPWAASAATSFLDTPAGYAGALEAAGFTVQRVTDRASAANAALDQIAANAAGGPAPLGLHLVMGKSTPDKVANMAKAIRANVLAPTEIVASIE